MRVIALLVVLMACGKGDRERQREAPPEPQRSDGCENAGGTVCVDDDVHECLADGKIGKPLQRCDGACNAGKCVDTCSVRDVELIYVVDDHQSLFSFDPRKLPADPFHRIATLGCESKARPFSMAVDRMGIAWINYESGVLHRVSIIDGKCMQAREPTGAPALFGMGFVSDGPNTTTEKLFVAAYKDSTFAMLDVEEKRPRWWSIGQFHKKHNPELTGTGAGRLYGFFPEDGSDAFVQEIAPGTGALVGEPMPVGSPRGQVNGWAFAHWGGKFYVFITIESSSMVYEIDGKTHKSRRVLDHVPYRIVGAGVSTCAPLLESVAP